MTDQRERAARLLALARPERPWSRAAALLDLMRLGDTRRSVRAHATAWGWSPSRVQRLLQELSAEGLVAGPAIAPIRLPSPTASHGQVRRYAFAGKVIRLTEADLTKWQEAYPNLVDIRAELTALDDFYDRELAGPERKRWFVRCSQALNQRNKEARKGLSNGHRPDLGKGYRPLGLGG